jgi:hypothetical protein
MPNIGACHYKHKILLPVKEGGVELLLLVFETELNLQPEFWILVEFQRTESRMPFGVIQTRTSPTFSRHYWNNAKGKQGE